MSLLSNIKKIIRKILHKDIIKSFGSVGKNVIIPSNIVISGGVIYKFMTM